MTTTEEPGQELEVRPDAELSPVLDAELVPRPEPPPRPTLIGQVIEHPVQAVVRGIIVVRESPKARVAITPVRVGARATYTTGQGFKSWWTRAVDAATFGKLRRAEAAAETANDPELLLKTRAALEAARDKRQARILRLPLIFGACVAVTLGLLVATWVLLLIGAILVWAFDGGSTWDSWWAGVAVFWDTVGTWGRRAVAAVLWAAGPVIVWAAYREGLRRGMAHRWLLSGNPEEEVDITPSIVVIAYRDCGIAELAKRIRVLEDGGGGMVGPITKAGCGQEFDVSPPKGATSLAAILARRDRIAETMGRHPYELHMSIVGRGVIRNWAAYPGALDKPIGTSPLIIDTEMRADYRRGKAPWGVNLRGDVIEISVFQRHLTVTGQSNQGKTRTIIALMLWLSLDPKVEFWLADLKGMNDKTGVSDWEPFRGIATKLIVGPTDDHVVQATEMLEAAVQEMNRRLTEGGKWKPLIVNVDEAQKAYMCPKVGDDKRPYGGRKATSRFYMAAREILNQGRVVDVLLWQGTQDPTNENFPELIRENAHIRGCLAIGTESKAGMALGEKAVEAGAAPHLLRPGLDKGTLVVAGDGAPLDDPAQSSVTVRTYFIDHDAAVEIANRAKVKRGPLQITDAEEVRDIVADVADALGRDDLVRASDMAARLRELAPDYQPYRTLDGTQLAELLGAEGVEVKFYKGHPTVRRERVYRVLDEREGE